MESEKIEVFQISEEEKCFAVAVSMVLILSLFVVVRSSALSLCFSQLRTAWLRWSEAMAESMRSKTRSRPGADPYQRYVLAQAHARKMVYARRMDWFLFAALNLALISIVFQISLGRPRWIDLRSSWVLLAYQVPILCMLHCPQLGKSMSLDFHYLFFMLLLLFLTSPLGSRPDQTVSYSFMGFVSVSLPATVVPTRLCSVVLGQAALMVMCIYRAFSEHLFMGLCEDVPGSQRVERNLVSWTLYFLVAASLIFLMVDALIKHQVTSKIRESDKQVQLSATTSLLELTCDAVVRLDASMRLEDHSPKLAAMLLRMGTSLKGTTFTDLLCDSDGHCPEFQLDLDTTTAATARAFQTQMVDCCSNKFKVEIFSVKYSLTDGQKCHIVGLRDLEDQESLAMRAHGASHAAGTDSVLVEGCASPSLALRSTTSLGSDSLGLLGQWRLRPVPPSPCVLETSKENFLQIDVDAQVVIAATAPYHSLAGRQLPNIFGPESLSLLWRVVDEERHVAMANSPGNRELQLPNRLVTFSNMPFFLPEGVLEISGSMKVAVTGHGNFQVILCFVDSHHGCQTSL